MKNFKKRKYNSLDGSFLKNHIFQKKHKANVLANENQIPIDWHEVKIILDATVVERYLNNRKSGSTMSPSHREQIFVQKIPRLNQNVFSEKNNVMVKLEIPEDIGVDYNLSLEDSLVFPAASVKQEDKNTFHDTEFIEPLPEEFQCRDRDNFTNEAALKNEVVESECCYEDTINDQEFKDALKNEELFVGEEFIHEASIPIYENMESNDQEDNEEIIKMKTRSTRKRKRCLECDDCNHGLEKKSQALSHSKVVTPKLPVKNPKKRKSQAPSKEQITNQEPTQPKSEKAKMHPEKIHVDEGGKSSDKICAKKTLELTPIGQSYTEYRQYFMEMESQHIKLYCFKCEMTRDKIISRVAPNCDICKSRLSYQCQKCKETRNYYSHIWEHLMNQNIGCSVSDSFIGVDEPASAVHRVPTVSSNEPKNSNGAESPNSTNQGSPKITSNGAKSYDCEICDFKGATTTQLDEHIQNVHLHDKTNRKGFADSFNFGEVRFIKHEELCGVTVRFPCRFCPLTCYDTNILSRHIAIMHLGEVDGRNIGEFIREARNFRRMVKEVNNKKFNDNLKNGTLVTDENSYHNGIDSMLKPICIECKADGPHNSECCAKCRVNLNFVCLKCDELFSKYSLAWDHATRMCENRSFTLTVEETPNYRAKVNASTSDEDACSTGESNASKSIESSHVESPDIQNLYSCPKNQSFFYTCPFCCKSSLEFQVIEKHIAWNHIDKFHCENTLEKILDHVIKKKRPRRKKPNYSYDVLGRRIRRKFSENLQLAKFYCPNCNETVHKKFRSVIDTRKCPKCNCKLRVYCKMCNKYYVHWEKIAAHFKTKNCLPRKYEVDHSYCVRQILPEMTMNLVAEDRDVA